MIRRNHVAFAIASLAPIIFHANTVAAQEGIWSFGVLGASTVTNTGDSVITGNVGVSPGGAIVGFPPGIVIPPYTFHANDAVASEAQAELVIAYNALQANAPTANLTSQNLGGLTLGAGVYEFDGAADLTGTLTLDAAGNPNARFVFLIDSTLTTASLSSINLINEAQGGNVFFVVGSSATLGTDTAFAGQILALASITLTTGATINCGAALARTGAVTLDTNTIGVCVVESASLEDILDALDEGSSENADAVADAIDDYVAGGGTLPPGFEDLAAFLTPAELELALLQLSGEIGSAVAPEGSRATRAFLSQIFDRMDAANDTIGPQTQPDRGQPGTTTVRVLGYGQEDGAPAASVGQAYMDAASSPAPRRWNVWTSVYGESSEVDGDAGVGSHDRSGDAVGVAIGLDYLFTPDFRMGVAFSGGRSDFSLSDGYGHGSSDIYQAALYGRKNFGAAYVAAAAVYAWNDVSTSRTLDFDGGDRLTADFSAHDIAGQIEAGYRFALPESASLPGSAGITPYAGVQVQSFTTPSYSESSASGSSPFALDHEEQTSTWVHTEIGAKFDRSIDLSQDALLVLRGRIAWAHDSSDNPGIVAGFQSLPGSTFRVEGADADGNALLLSAGAEIKLDSGLAFAALVDGSFGEQYESYYAAARVSYAW